MKTSPLKVTAGGVTPQTEQEPVVEKPKKDTKVADAIVDFVTPDSIGEALMNFIPFGGVGSKAIGKTKVFQQLMKKVPGLEKMFKSGKTITKKQKFDFQKGLDDSLKAKGGVGGDTKNLVNGKEYYKDALHYGKATSLEQYDNMIADATKGVGQKGKATDAALAKMNYNVATELKPQNVKKIGSQSGRGIFEVSYPDGTTQRFWRSSGTGGKSVMHKGKEVSSEGFFGTLPGHMDSKVPIDQAIKRADKMAARGTEEHARIIDALTNNDGYFIKSDGWQGYGSKTYEQTGAALKEMFDKGLIK
tara:strand:- start:705 stop:1613 length:909 start_codon:yes stop_codon:yes gene_type:complete